MASCPVSFELIDKLLDDTQNRCIAVKVDGPVPRSAHMIFQMSNI